MEVNRKRVLIIGATSGIGYELAQLYLKQDAIIGIAGRRIDKLKEIQNQSPNQVHVEEIDITQANAIHQIQKLIDKTKPIDVFIQCAGIGYQNATLDKELELQTVQTNCLGFTQSILTAYHYFKKQDKGHIVAISSIAGTKGLGIAPAYSATKRMQNTYIDALEQLCYINNYNIHFTDIKPGFIKTPLLNTSKNNYPLIMEVDVAAKKIFNAIEKKKRRPIIDWKFNALVFFWKLIPSFLWKQLPIKPKSK